MTEHRINPIARLGLTLLTQERMVAEALDDVEKTIGRSREISIARTQIELGFLMAQKGVGLKAAEVSTASPPEVVGQQSGR